MLQMFFVLLLFFLFFVCCSLACFFFFFCLLAWRYACLLDCTVAFEDSERDVRSAAAPPAFLICRYPLCKEMAAMIPDQVRHQIQRMESNVMSL
jgi:hypothetical protein